MGGVCESVLVCLLGERKGGGVGCGRLFFVKTFFQALVLV